MNNDLISREALKKALKSSCDLCNDKNTNWCEHCCPNNDFEDLIDNAPTVPNEYMRGYEAAEREYKRPQGEWKMIGSIGLAYTCDKCDNPNVIPSNFCPNCGAKMKGGAV